MSASEYMKELKKAMAGRLVLVPGVDAIIRNSRGEILITKRADNGEWDLPGGGVDPGELPADSIRREVKEETGLEVRVREVAGVFGGKPFRHTYPDGQEIEGFSVTFECEVVGGELRSRDGEATAFRFVAPKDMPPLAWPYPPELFSENRSKVVFQ